MKNLDMHDWIVVSNDRKHFCSRNEFGGRHIYTQKKRARFSKNTVVNIWSGSKLYERMGRSVGSGVDGGVFPVREAGEGIPF